MLVGGVITTQIVLFYTLINTGFKHFFGINQPIEPDWHIKVLALLLFTFCGKFCSFCKLLLPS